jgi:hypothetical protein
MHLHQVPKYDRYLFAENKMTMDTAFTPTYKMSITNREHTQETRLSTRPNTGVWTAHNPAC